MKTLKVKVITGFRDDQYQTIDAQEAHKAYYLFLNPEERAVFSNGVALIGKNIQAIEPDYHSTMGWNATHKIQSEDWNELRENGISEGLRNVLFSAKNVAYAMIGNKSLGTLGLSEASKEILLT